MKTTRRTVLSYLAAIGPAAGLRPLDELVAQESGQTAGRVLIHVDTEQAPGELVNSRIAYVSVSRAQFDVQMYTNVYTNDAKALGYELSRDVSHPTAIQQEPVAAQRIEPQSVSIGTGQGLSVR